MSRTDLYREHLRRLDSFLADSLERAGRAGLTAKGVLFHAGRSRTYHRDDREILFRPTPHFLRWVPLNGPEHVVLARPGETPLVVRVRPNDYWYDTSPPPISYWEGAVRLEEVASFSEVPGVMGPMDGVAYFGDSPEAAEQLGIPSTFVEPDALRLPLDWHRATKTEHEVECLRRAARAAAAGHEAARRKVEAGGTERDIHLAYLEASGHLEGEVPYDTIVALNDKAAILHYQHKRGAEGPEADVLLLDAGAAFEGHAADITRTWAVSSRVPDTFHQLLRGVDALERELVAMVTLGRSYVDIHLEAHRLTAELLAESGILKIGPEEAVERRLTRPFLPHGVGHQLGLQVHDVGGHQAAPEGRTLAPPDDHVLRNTRTLEEGHVVTIEPGLYFIPMLLDPLRESKQSSIDWALVDQLTPFGGIRIEDNIVCRAEGPEDFTRPLLAGPAD